ncbi:hypothetical protein GSU68_19295 (plasmid) [Rathayibacter sp. VKM Ac-2759]|uniref:hypothetical protein n=1 Tax=Rathayibacter sp. VKM Ac-2759 TaxID=2609252 RepID=UPI001316BE81|nr:hypothetical protein [Rathayibacter sp. VKM Ac-2759]QHC68863.1 hypothetical protein GSU68_19295 [Rathayibacter sp. VKM Ac-2759]
MMHDETRAYAHALLTHASLAGADDTYARAAHSLALTTLRDNDDRNLPGHTGEPGDYDVPLLTCAALLDELASRVAFHAEHAGRLTSRDIVLCELRERVVQDGTDQADIASALLDYTIHRRDELGRADHPDYSSVHTRLHRIDGRNHGSTATAYYEALLAASAAVINDLIAQVVELTNVSTEQDVRDDLREYVRMLPTPARL